MAGHAPGSQREIRKRNLSRVLYAIAEQGPSSRAAVAVRLGLTRAAVSTLVDELLHAGLLTEQGPTPPGGGPGRPGTALALTDSGPCGLGAEIGVDHLAVCAVDTRGQVRARVRLESDDRTGAPGAEGRGDTPDSLGRDGGAVSQGRNGASDAHRRNSTAVSHGRNCTAITHRLGISPGQVLARLRALVDEVAARARALGLHPAGLAVAVPGLVARGTTTVVRAPNLGWYDIDLAPALQGAGVAEGAAPLPLTVDNEANLGALAELWLDSDRVPRDFVHVSAEVGIGAAVVLEGELLRGNRGFAGELGHVPVRPEGPDCACGGSGCLEQYAGEVALLRAAGIAPESPRHAALAALSEQAAHGGTGARAALEEAGTALGIALAGAVSLLDPGALVLGGALARFAPWLRPALERELTERTAAPGEPPALLVSGLGADGPLLGAAHAAVRVVLDDPLSYAGTTVG